MPATTQLGTYQGVAIQCHGDDDTFVNATQMCKATGRRWPDYWRLQTTQEFVSELSFNVGIPTKDLVYSKRGNQQQSGGTWVHRRVAQDLARWCSAKFAVWVNGKIDDLLFTPGIREHNEAQIANIAPAIYATLSELKYQRVENHKVLNQCIATHNLCVDYLKAIQSRPNEQIEKVVETQLVEREGGCRQVQLIPGVILDVLQPGKFAIEIKHWKRYTVAMGQQARYAVYLEPDVDKRIHLFWKPFSTPPTQKHRRKIERECLRSGCLVTWHDWDDMTLPESRQLMLPLK